jgi:hypothetical protein
MGFCRIDVGIGKRGGERSPSHEAIAVRRAQRFPEVKLTKSIGWYGAEKCFNGTVLLRIMRAVNKLALGLTLDDSYVD